MSRPYAEVIGDPIVQSKSPAIHNFWLGKLGIDAEYRACHVRAEELADYFAARRADPDWRGCNITLPHKIFSMQFADEVERITREVGATNCVVCVDGRLIASNTDVTGIFEAVPDNEWPLCMIGAGGAARAVMPILDFWVSAWALRVIARDPVKAAQSLDPKHGYQISFVGFDDAESAMKGARGIINASPLGMVGQPAMPGCILDAVALTDPNAWVFDMVYAPLETELLRAARLAGRRTVDGLTMLIGQAAAAFEQFFGQPAPREHDAELRELLTK